MKILVEFDFGAGFPGCFGGGPDSWQPPEPDEISISKIEIAGTGMDAKFLDECHRDDEIYQGLGMIGTLWINRQFEGEGFGE